MTEIQQQAVVAGFMHVLTSSPKVYEDFQKIRRNPVEVGRFIAQTMNLKDHPSAADLAAMAKYADAQLNPHVEKLNAMQGGVPKQVGGAFGLEHEDDDDH